MAQVMTILKEERDAVSMAAKTINNNAAPISMNHLACVRGEICFIKKIMPLNLPDGGRSLRCTESDPFGFFW
jgi:hypothetical protein